MRLILFGGLRPFSRSGAVRNALAGVTLASMNIPQVLGYTRIAGTPVVTGLYTVLLPLVAFAVFGSSRHLVVAADSATAVIFSSPLSRMAAPASEKYMALVGMVALLTAGILFLAWIFKLGFLADFLSRTVLVGFLTGVGFQVGIAMLSDMFGVTVGSHSTLVQAWEILQGLPRSNLPTMALSTLVAGSILIGNRVAPRLPVSLFAVGGTIAASASFRFAEQGIAVIGPVPGGLPPIGLPDVTWSECPCAAAGGRFMLCDDNRAKRRDVARIRAALSRTRRRGRRHPRAVSRECSRRGERDVRGQRQPDADRHGGTRGSAQPGRTTGICRCCAVGAAVHDRPAPVPATLRVGQHRLHDRLRDDRREEVCVTFVAKARASFILPSSPRRQLSRSASSKVSCWRSLCRSSGTWAIAIARTQ